MLFVRALHSAGFAVLERFPGASSVELARTGTFDLVAWVATPRRDFDVTSLTTIGRHGVPLVALLDDATPTALAACLQAGADACLQLDADHRVVAAQVHAVLRRSRSGQVAPAAIEAPDLGVIQVGGLRVDCDRCEVECEGNFVGLTASEFRIIEFMARNAGRVLRPHEILNAVSEDYQYQPREAQEVFKVYVRRIRRKLEPDENEPRFLVNVRGFGYRLQDGSSRTPLRAALA
jgi:DNA-binding response OmpR family regulator